MVILGRHRADLRKRFFDFSPMAQETCAEWVGTTSGISQFRDAPGLPGEEVCSHDEDAVIRQEPPMHRRPRGQDAVPSCTCAPPVRERIVVRGTRASAPIGEPRQPPPGTRHRREGPNHSSSRPRVTSAAASPGGRDIWRSCTEASSQISCCGQTASGGARVSATSPEPLPPPRLSWGLQTTWWLANVWC